jgi:hypothetical protein
MSIRQDFMRIKQQFFPQWDRQNQWRVRTTSKRNVQAYCDTRRRLIEIVLQVVDSDKLDRLLIHEICHAVGSAGHGKQWQARMERAAQKAEALGRHHLAQLLRDEIVTFKETHGSSEIVYDTSRPSPVPFSGRQRKRMGA